MARKARKKTKQSGLIYYTIYPCDTSLQEEGNTRLQRNRANNTKYSIQPLTDLSQESRNMYPNAIIQPNLGQLQLATSSTVNKPSLDAPPNNDKSGCYISLPISSPVLLINFIRKTFTSDHRSRPCLCRIEE